jgi:DNA polymerase
MLLAYAIDDGEPQIIDFTVSPIIPKGFFTAGEVWAHNSMFDRTVLAFNGYKLDVTRWRDTMVQAYCHSLPGSLDELGEVLGLPVDRKKSKEGRDLVNLFCKPRPANSKLRRATRETHPEEWEKFKEYAKQDIVAMRECHKRMPKTNYPNGGELARWHLDQVINDRGFLVDLDLVNGALATVEKEKARLKDKTLVHTNGELESTTQRDKTLEYILAEYGISLPDLTKDTLERRLKDDDIPEGVKELLRIRLQAGSSSTSKYLALRKAVNSDGRCRGTIQFAGAKRTGRAAGRVFQPQNLPSRGLLEEAATEFGIEAIKGGFAPDLFDNTTHLLISAVRGVVVAPKGRKLVVADLSNIEGRKAAWFAGENWKLQAFIDFDQGKGHDLYNLAYSRAFNVPVESVTKAQRAIGKVLELFLAYEGGVGAFMTGAMTYGFDIEKLARDIWATLPEKQKAESLDYYNFCIKQKRPTHGLSREGFVTCDTLKRLWREANPNIAALWKKIQNSVVHAITNPGNVSHAGEHLSMLRQGAWLYIKLPSGRLLCYPSPRLDEHGKVSYMGDNPYTRKWSRINSYSGKFFENICQASARDVLYEAKPIAEKAGYQVVLHVHDELVTETPDTGGYTADGLSKIMSSDFGWTKGLPLAAAGFESYRYRK